MPSDLPGLIRSIEGVEPEILYLDCSGTELMRRYDETRRRHPLAPDRPAEDGIARERQMTMPLRNTADNVLDATNLPAPPRLGDELKRRYGGNSDQPVLTVASFAFARGISRTADLVFDLRFFQTRTGSRSCARLPGQMSPGSRLPFPPIRRGPRPPRPYRSASHRLNSRYWAAGKSYVTVAFGCTGGRHRSVAAAVGIGERIRGAGFAPECASP